MVSFSSFFVFITRMGPLLRVLPTGQWGLWTQKLAWGKPLACFPACFFLFLTLTYHPFLSWRYCPFWEQNSGSWKVQGYFRKSQTGYLSLSTACNNSTASTPNTIELPWAYVLTTLHLTYYQRMSRMRKRGSRSKGSCVCLPPLLASPNFNAGETHSPLHSLPRLCIQVFL